MDIITMSEKKHKITSLVQELFDDYNRLEEVHTQFKCENDLKLRENINTIRNQEDQIKEKDLKINELETDISNKKIVINDYEKMIRDLEDKIQYMLHEKEEEGRFDMLRVQAKTIHEKENEIERLNQLLKKKDEKEDKKINNVLDMIQNTSDEISIQDKNSPNQDDSGLNPDNEQIEYGECSADIAADRMALSIDNLKESSEENKSEDDDEDDDYEILTYRKKEYWIKKNENPQYVYEVLEEDGLGEKLGVYQKTSNGKMKVFLDKK